ncbi:MAG: PQQ-dependent sugar dehydrogenase [Nannocystaceae bacterium]|nr:PQQ-dependent sugar dehydrogenase [bacterium]
MNSIHKVLCVLAALSCAACPSDDGSGDETDGATGQQTGGSSSSSGVDPTNVGSSGAASSSSSGAVADSSSSGEPSTSSTTDTDTDTGPDLECPYTPVEGTPAITFEQVADGFREPTLVVGDPVDPDVLYVLQKSGEVKRLQPGETTAPAENWLDLPVATASEAGLLGMAFHPDYADNGLVYVLHSDSVSSWRITEFLVEGGAVNTGSARDVFGTAQPAANHNGGMIQFGPDGMLYASVGDGGPQNDACGNGQNGNTHHGSIIRIDVTADGNADSATSCGSGGGCSCPGVDGFDYTIPADNPFVGDGSIRDEIYAYGFRNPWRFSFDPVDGQLFVADVGQGAWEEVTVVEAGTNHGWGDMEGNHCFNDGGCDTSAAPGQTNADGLVAPVAEYSHNGGGCSITGLGNYRSCEMPGFAGTYFYADLCTGEVSGVTYDGTTASVTEVLGNVPGNNAAYGGGYNAYGDVFIAAASFVDGSGTIFRIAPAG